MSVTNQTNTISASGNGVTTLFSFPFKVFDSSEILVYLVNNTTGAAVLKTITTDYTVSINTVSEGGSVTWVTAPASGYSSFIKRVVPYTQSAVIPTGGVLPAKQIENQLDLQTMAIIQINESVNRCAKVGITSSVTSVTLPEPVDGYALAWSGTAGTIVNYPIDAGALAAALASASASATSASTSASTASTQATAASASAAAAAASAAAIAALLPTGMIMMWKGTIATIPSGWVLCNGSNGTPDLRNKFIVAADADVSSIAKSTISGSAAQTGGSTTIAQANLPAVGLTLTIPLSSPNTGGSSGVPQNSPGPTDTNSNTYTTSAMGSGTAYVQPYYALAYIMKT